MENQLTEWLSDHFPEVEAKAFYRYIFPAGELDVKGAMTKGKYTGVVCRIGTGERRWDSETLKYKAKVYRYTLTDELEAIDEAVNSEDFCICRPLSYAGKSATAEHARMLYAIAVDVDKLISGPKHPTGLVALWERHIQKVKRIPRPTFIVSSGTGLHLYYVLERPVALYREIAYELQEYKRELTRLIWHDTIVNIKHSYEIQQEGIYQGFRMPGTVTKNGGRVKAFLTGERVTIEYLNTFVGSEYKAKRAAEQKRGKVHISEAAERWPDWYERRVIRGEQRGAWAVNRSVYEWWRRKILEGATVGHRYYCCMMLAIYAQKCSKYDIKHNPDPVTREELERDCIGLLEYMEGLTESEDNHFGLDDIQDALEAYEERWITYPRAAIEYRTGIVIPANKRNGQTQEAHLEEARALRDIRARRRGERWDAHNGRKSQYETVQEWRREHPQGKKADCIRETGLSKPTVYKHWAGVEEQAAAEARPEREAQTLEQLENKVELLTRALERQKQEAREFMARLARVKTEIDQMPEGQKKAESIAEYLELYENERHILEALEKL